MKNKRSLCLTLFLSMLRISAFTFGGGFVIIPLIRQRFVEKLGWFSEEDMIDMMAIAQSSPGAVSLNIGVQLGWRIAGVMGSVSAVAGTLLPPMFWLSLISSFYDVFRTSPVVDAFMRSMQAAVAAVILYACFSMAKALKNRERISTWMLLALAVGLSFAGVSAVYLLLMGAVFGAVTTLREVKRHVR